MKKILLIFIPLLLVSAVLVLESVPSPRLGGDIPFDLQLQAPKDRIWKSEVKGDLVEYTYVSNKEVNQGIKVINGKEILEDVSLRDYNFQVYKIDDKNYIRDIYSGAPFIKEKATGKWLYLSKPATTTKESFDMQTKVSLLEKIESYFSQIALADSGTFYPDPGTGGTAVDGALEYTISSFGTWAEIHDAATGSGAYPTIAGTDLALIEAGTTSNKWRDLHRSVFLFDVSSLAGKTVTNVSQGIYCSGKRNGLGGSLSFNIFSSNPASNNTLTTADYDQIGNVAWATAIVYASISTGTRNVFTFNTTGISAVQSAIDGDGIVKTSLRHVSDSSNSAPSWVSGEYDTWNGSFVDEGVGYENRFPYLEITYTEAIAPATEIPQDIILFK